MCNANIGECEPHSFDKNNIVLKKKIHGLKNKIQNTNGDRSSQKLEIWDCNVMLAEQFTACLILSCRTQMGPCLGKRALLVEDKQCFNRL